MDNIQERVLRRQDWAILFSGACFKFCVVAFYMIAIITILKDLGFDLKQLSWIYIPAILETLKCVVSPFLERFRWKIIGHFKGWFLISLSLMLFCFVLLYFIQLQQAFYALLIVCVLLNIGSLFFGCAVLGLTCVLLPYEQRGIGNALQVIAGRIGKMAGGGLVLIIYQHYDWQSAVVFMIVFTLLLLIQTLFYVEQKTVRRKEPDYHFSALFHRFVLFWQQPHTGLSWALLLFLFFIPSSMVVSIFVPSLQEAGWSAQNIGVLLTLVEPLCVMLFTPFSGMLLQKYGRIRLTRGILFVQIFLFALFYAVQWCIFASLLWMAAPILLLSISYGLLVPCVMTLLMDKSSPQLATLDTSLQFSTVLLGAYLAGFFALRLADWGGYRAVYIGATLLAVVLLYFAGKVKEKLTA